MKIGVIGYGNMASAIATAIVDEKLVANKDIYASARNYEKLVNNCSKININACKDNKDVIINSDFVILCVKPYMVEKVLEDNLKYLDNKVLISIVAGYDFDKYEKILNGICHHISTIPNTPIAVRSGILICENKHNLSEEELEYFSYLFNKISLMIYVDSNNLSIAGTMAGCTPAFTAMYMEALADAGVKYGLTRTEAYNIVAQMLVGTGKLYLATNEHPGIMKDKVCSPHGTTIKGVSALEKNGFRGSVISAIDEIEK